jgi:hypothetical protein
MRGSKLLLSNKIITDTPGIDEYMFRNDFLNDDYNAKHKFSVPIFIYRLTSGTPVLDSYKSILHMFSYSKTRVYFVLTNLNSVYSDFVNMSSISHEYGSETSDLEPLL